MSKDRLEAFSDGVIAILNTIMVLELRTPHAAYTAIALMWLGQLRTDRPRHGDSGRGRRRHRSRHPADRGHRGDHRRALAAVLPAVEHPGQAHRTAPAFYLAYGSQIAAASLVVLLASGVVLTEVLFGAAAGAVLVIGGPLLLRSTRRRIAAGGSADRLADVRHLNRDTWRMPPLDQLRRPVISPLREAGYCSCAGT
jgi:hypothetical protein